jgi:hypothetical protein
MEQPAQNAIGPLFGLPPLTALALFFISRNSIVRNAEIHDLEEQSTPGHETLRTLLVPGQAQNDRVFVSLEDKVQDRRDVLLGTGRWRVEQISGKRDEGRKRLLDNTGQNLTLLAEPIHRTRVSTREKNKEARQGGRTEMRGPSRAQQQCPRRLRECCCSRGAPWPHQVAQAISQGSHAR